jgi:putative spermidine/putrescine transport system permease protein
MRHVLFNTFRRERILPYLYLAPALLVIIVFFLGGFALALTMSLGYFPVVGLKEISLKYYQEIISQAEFWHSLSFTCYIAFISALISTICGVFLAYQLLKIKFNQRFASFLYQFPLAVPHLVAAVMILFLLSQGGIIARVMLKLGVLSGTGEFPAFFYSKNAVGIIIIYCWKEIPFVTLMVYTVLQKIDTKLGEAAQILGASSRQTFFHVILPLSMPSIISASVIIFAYSFGAFELPYLLGATYPKTLSVWAYLNYISPELLDRPLAMAINTLISLGCALLVFVYFWSTKKYFRNWS